MIRMLLDYCQIVRFFVFLNVVYAIGKMLYLIYIFMEYKNFERS